MSIPVANFFDSPGGGDSDGLFGVGASGEGPFPVNYGCPAPAAGGAQAHVL